MFKLPAENVTVPAGVSRASSASTESRVRSFGVMGVVPEEVRDNGVGEKAAGTLGGTIGRTTNLRGGGHRVSSDNGGQIIPTGTVRRPWRYAKLRSTSRPLKVVGIKSLSNALGPGPK